MEVCVHHVDDSPLFLLVQTHRISLLLLHYAALLLQQVPLLQLPLICLDPVLEDHNGLAPEVRIDLVPAERLELVFPLGKVLQVLLEVVPQPDAYLGGQVVGVQVLRDLNEVSDLVVQRELLYLVQHVVQHKQQLLLTLKLVMTLYPILPI